jgi:hypothetical protein
MARFGQFSGVQPSLRGELEGDLSHMLPHTGIPAIRLCKRPVRSRSIIHIIFLSKIIYRLLCSQKISKATAARIENSTRFDSDSDFLFNYLQGPENHVRS